MKRVCLIAVCLAFCLGSAAQALDVGAVAIHGFVSQGYLKSDEVNFLAETEKGTYQFNEAGINFNYTRDKLRVGAQVFSRDLGDLGNNDIVLDWAVGEYRLFDQLGLRAGRIKTPFGFYNQGRDVDLLRTPILLPSSVYDEGSRDLVSATNGFGIFGVIDANMFGGFEYEAYIGAVEVDDDSLFVRGAIQNFENGLKAELSAGAAGAISNFKAENKNMGGGALRWETPLPGFRLGASTMAGEVETNSDFTLTLALPSPPFPVPSIDFDGALYLDTEIKDTWVFSGEFTWKGLLLASEYYQLKLVTNPEIRGIDLTTIGLPAMPPLDQSVTKYQGWYVMGSYQILPWLTAGLYYTEYYSNADDKDGQRFIDVGEPASYAWQKEWVPTLRFDPVQNWVIKAEVHFVDGSARCYDFQNPWRRDEDWNLYAIKTSYSF